MRRSLLFHHDPGIGYARARPLRSSAASAAATVGERPGEHAIGSVRGRRRCGRTIAADGRRARARAGVRHSRAAETVAAHDKPPGPAAACVTVSGRRAGGSGAPATARPASRPAAGARRGARRLAPTPGGGGSASSCTAPRGAAAIASRRPAAANCSRERAALPVHHLHAAPARRRPAREAEQLRGARCQRDQPRRRGRAAVVHPHEDLPPVLQIGHARDRRKLQASGAPPPARRVERLAVRGERRDASARSPRQARSRRR